MRYRIELVAGETPWRGPTYEVIDGEAKVTSNVVCKTVGWRRAQEVAEALEERACVTS